MVYLLDMSLFKATNTLDRVFEVSIILKALDGIIEVLSGIAVFFIKPEQITHFARWLTHSELRENPHSFLALHFLHSAQKFAETGGTFAAIYLLSHGIVKVVLVAAILRGQLWAYKWMIAFLVAFIVYQVIRIFQQPAFWLVALTVFDVFIVYLTVREDRRQHRLHPESESVETE